MSTSVGTATGPHRSQSRSLTIVGIGGSLKSRSTSLAALDVALDVVHLAGEEVRRFSVAELDLSFYRPGMEPPVTARELADAVAGADGVIWSSPMYHGTVGGAFKNALDWLQLLAERDPPYLTDKPVGLIATAGGGHALQAINTMEFIVRALRGWAVPFVVPITEAWRHFDDDGRPRGGRVENQLGTLCLEVMWAARRLRPATASPPSSLPVATVS